MNKNEGLTQTPMLFTRTSPWQGQVGVGVIELPASPRVEETWVPGGARREARARQPQQQQTLGR